MLKEKRFIEIIHEKREEIEELENEINEIKDALEELSCRYHDDLGNPLEFVWDNDHYFIANDDFLSSEEFEEVRSELNNISKEVYKLICKDKIEEEEDLWK